MNDKNNELKAALEDVRRAYRLLHAYHRRVNDMFYAVHEFLEKRGAEFMSWGPLNVWNLPQKTKPFFRPETWAWDLTPAYQIECVWHRSQGGMHHKLHVHAIADTGFDAAGEGEPDPARFEPPETSRSEIRVGLHRTCAKQLDWGAAWKKLSADPTRKNTGVHRVKVGNDDYAYRYFAMDLVELGDEQAVKEKLLQPLDEWLKSS